MYKKRAHDFICSAPSLNSIPLIQLKSSVYKNKYRRIVVEIRELSNSIREISFFLFHFHVSRAVMTPNRKCRLLLVQPLASKGLCMSAVLLILVPP